MNAAANVIPFHSPALTRAVLKWRAQAWWILGDPDRKSVV